MKTAHMITLLAAVALLGACATREPRQAPHHYSTDRYGNRIACYATAKASEYECTPVRTARAYDNPYYDPFSMGWYYDWPVYPYAYYPYPIYYPAPPRHHFYPR